MDKGGRECIVGVLLLVFVLPCKDDEDGLPQPHSRIVGSVPWRLRLLLDNMGDDEEAKYDDDKDAGSVVPDTCGTLPDEWEGVVRCWVVDETVVFIMDSSSSSGVSNQYNHNRGIKLVYSFGRK